MPRAQNAHAIVNAGFLFKLDTAKAIKSANIVYSNISPTFMRAGQTEKLLVGQQLFSNEVMLKALKKLDEELVPMEVLPEPSASCRKTLALGLFYKVSCFIGFMVISVTTERGVLNPISRSDKKCYWVFPLGVFQ